MEYIGTQPDGVDKESDEKALTITNKWLAADTEQVVKELSQKIEKF